ncbi:MULTISPECIES: hypothetical protein [unclassified Nocardioides]|uniref:hypothetical protein n=1 Tax=unclassified Nocardioides TaxID=2615069 RepID=UPI0009F0A31B|nr:MULTISPECIES: hypothetical protein [unclassified Nocardioides]GAW50466.1 hypothetical protein PD653B2_2801 [Nocardioides sp. PD653-B2]GAW53905.1 hypothetical protein PD653_1309 [Nocardioides sp. PD653]
MRRLAALVLPALLAWAALPAAAAPADPLVQVSDPTGDVHVYAGVHHLSGRQLRSIDVSDVTLTPVGDDGSVRLSVTVARLTGSKRFDQLVLVELLPPAGSGQGWHASIGFSPQHHDWAYADRYLDDEGHYRGCEPLQSRSRRGTTVQLDVPARCVPPQPTTIRVDTYTGLFRTDASPSSHDRVRVPGSYDLR